jgi:hypothetical protein
MKNVLLLRYRRCYPAMGPSLFITLVAIVAAIIGVQLSSLLSVSRVLVPLSAGLLLGMAIFIILPETLDMAGMLPVALLGAVGAALFALVESWQGLFRRVSMMATTGVLPLGLAISLHNWLDGWNIGVALSIRVPHLVWVFTTGMAIHKLCGGLAVGAVFRSSIREGRGALFWAAGCEAVTLIGVASQQFAQKAIGPAWSIWLLAITGGSFFFLGYLTLAAAHRHHNLRSSLPAVGAGLGAMWIVSLIGR